MYHSPCFPSAAQLHLHNSKLLLHKQLLLHLVVPFSLSAFRNLQLYQLAKLLASQASQVGLSCTAHDILPVLTQPLEQLCCLPLSSLLCTEATTMMPFAIDCVCFSLCSLPAAVHAGPRYEQQWNLGRLCYVKRLQADFHRWSVAHVCTCRKRTVSQLDCMLHSLPVIYKVVQTCHRHLSLL